MQTHSHLVITVFLAQRIVARQASGAAGKDRAKSGPPLHGKAFLLGSVVPDIPLILLTAGFVARDRAAGQPGNDGSHVEHLYRYLFFQDPRVMAAHKLLHAPLLPALYGAVGYWAWRQRRSWGTPVLWFVVTCVVHTLFDIHLHYDDRPLLLSPVDWKARFRSPVSYWDPSRHGIPVSVAEHALVLDLLVYLAVNWQSWRLKARRRSQD